GPSAALAGGEREHRIVHEPVREDRASSVDVASAGEVGETAPGLLDDDRGGGDVPWTLQEEHGEVRRAFGDLERRVLLAALERPGGGRERGGDRPRLGVALPLRVRDERARLGEAPGSADPNRPAGRAPFGRERAAAADRPMPPVDRGRVADADDDLAVDLERDQRAPM